MTGQPTGASATTAADVQINVMLPSAHEGHGITWQAWKSRAIAVCGRVPAREDRCTACGYSGPRFLALGAADHPQEIRAYGHHCPACKETRVFWRYDPPAGSWTGRLVEIFRSTPNEVLK